MAAKMAASFSAWVNYFIPHSIVCRSICLRNFAALLELFSFALFWIFSRKWLKEGALPNANATNNCSTSAIESKRKIFIFTSTATTAATIKCL